MFDMKKDKWFIRTPTPEISETVQLWLFEQGIGWQYPVGEKVVHHTNAKILMNSSCEKSCFCLADYIDEKYDGQRKEIALTFKTIVDSVTYPEPEVIETESQKQMKVLEEQIQKLIVEKDKLKETIAKEK